MDSQAQSIWGGQGEATVRLFLRWWIVIAVPVVLTMGVVRLTTMSWYPRWEYQRSGFPADPFEMPTEERLRLAQASIRFLNRPTTLEALEVLELPDGTPAYNDRELSHMADVKRVYDQLTAVAGFFLVAAVVAGWALVRRGRASLVWAAISDGGLLTLGLLVALAIWMALGFEAFFTAFHGVFFSGDSWLFSYSDTLIRLFPLPFWQHAGLLIAGTVSITALVLALFGRAMQKRLDRAAASSAAVPQ